MLVPPGSGTWRRPSTCHLQQRSLSFINITIYEEHIYSKATCTDNPTMQSNPKEYHSELHISSALLRSMNTMTGRRWEQLFPTFLSSCSLIGTSTGAKESSITVLAAWTHSNVLLATLKKRPMNVSVGYSACFSSWLCIKWKGKAEAQQWWLLPLSVVSLAPMLWCHHMWIHTYNGFTTGFTVKRTPAFWKMSLKYAQHALNN